MEKAELRKLPSARQGYALEVVVLFLCAVTVLGVAVYLLTVPRMRSSVYQTKKTAAFYTAEAGLQDALQVISDTATWTQGFTNKPLMTGYYTVKVDTITNPATVTSKGWVHAAAPGRTVQTMVKLNITPDSGMLDYALGAFTGDINLQNNSVVNGNIFARGAIINQGQATINGTTTNVVPGPLNPVIPKPADPCNYAATTTVLGPCYVDGDLNVAINMTVNLAGTLYVTGKFSMTNNTTLLGRYSVYIGGDMEVLNNSVIGEATGLNCPFIYAPGPGTVLINNNGASSYVYIYAPERAVTLSNNAAIAGSIIGGTAKLWNNGAVMHAPVIVPDGLELGGPGLRWHVLTNSWEEKY